MEGSPGTVEGLETMLRLLSQHAHEGNFDRVEDVWLQLVEASSQLGPHVETFVAVAERFVADPKKQDRLGTLLELLLSVLPEDTPLRPRLRVYWLLVYCFPERRELQDEFCERYEQLYPLASAERAFYEVCSPSSSLDAAASLRRLENLLKFRQGAFVYHRSGWGVGKVEAVDPFLKQVKVDLEGKRGHRIAIDAVDSILEPLDPRGFLALRYRGGDELRSLRDEDPVRLVDLVIDAFGNPLSLKDIKAKLAGDVVPSEVWARWWSRTRGLLRGTGLYRIGDRPPHLVERLAEAVSYESELVQKYESAPWGEGRQIARQVARKPRSEAWGRIREDLLRLAREGGPVEALEAALLIERAEGGSGDGGSGEGELAESGAGAPDLAEVDPGRAGSGPASPKAILSRLGQAEIVATVEALPSVDDQRRVAEGLTALRPDDWQEIATRLFLGTRDALADAALQTLERHAPERADAVVRDLVRTPNAAPNAFCLLAALHLSGADRPSVAALEEKGPRERLVLFLDLLEHLQHREARRGRLAVKGCVAKIQELLCGNDARVFREGVQAMAASELRDVHMRIVRNESLAPHTRGDLLALLGEYEPSLEPFATVPPWEENAIYVTAKGLAKRKEEFRVLMEDKLPKNFQDIGRAAGFGDLSENAEYTAALEERDQLTKRATQMKAELNIARTIEPSGVRTGIVGLGSRLRLRNVTTGEEVVYSVLGPWDGGPEDGVLSYKSPLGRLFLGRTAGEIVDAQLPGGSETFEILESSSHFDAAG